MTIAQATQIERLSETIDAGVEHLLALQHPDGYWWARLESNATITAEVLLLHAVWGISDRLPSAKIERYLRSQQQPSGGWELFYEDGGELSTSVEAYMALRILGVPPDDPTLRNARAFILERGGISRTRVFTKMHAALAGAFDWRGLPILPPALMFVPPQARFSIYDMSSWARGSTVPLIILFDKQPVWNVGISVDELYSEGRDNCTFELPPARDRIGRLFLQLDSVLRAMREAGIVPLRAAGIQRALEWCLRRQEPTGDWAGIIPPMLNALFALRALGYSIDDDPVQRGFEALQAFFVQGDETFWVQPSISVIWDTALAVRALADAGVPPDHPAIQRAGEWLLSKQIDKPGDWCVRSRGEPGGWAFEFCNDWYPDVDDTSAVVMALHYVRLPDDARRVEAMRRAAAWIDGMQSSNGGWGAYDVDNTNALLNKLPYGDLRAMIDPPTADLTAHCIEMHLLSGTLRDPVVLERGVRFLLGEQEHDGSWFGRWGVNYINGTGAAMCALAYLPPQPIYRSAFERGAAWFVEVQNADGGWGETCRSYDDPAQKAIGPSTPSQTSWALSGLVAGYDRLEQRGRDAVRRGIEFLIERQLPSGTWDEPQFTGTGFPGHFYLNYNLYRLNYTLSALGRFRALV